MPDSMSQASRDRLLAAVDEVAGLVADGASPDDAIVKVAESLGLPAGHVPLVVNAYNIGRTARQREDGRTPLEKAAEFELADPARCLSRLFPDRVKAASRVDPDYRRPPLWYARGEHAALAKHAASLVPALGPPAPPLPALGEAEVRRAAAEKRAASLAVEEARLAASAARGALAESMAKLADYFRAPGATPPVDVAADAAALYGDAGAAAVRAVADVLPPAVKSAAARRGAYAVDESAAPYRHVREAVERAGALLHAKAAHAEAERAAAPPAPAPPAPRGGGVLDGPAEKKAVGFLDQLLKIKGVQGLGPQMSPETQDSRVARVLNKIGTPEHSQELATIEARAMLHDIFNGDPILSGHDPNEVAVHYNRLSGAAPGLARSPLAAIPLMRKAVEQGQLDSFDVKEVADAEHKFREARKPADRPTKAEKASSVLGGAHAGASVLS